MLGLGLEIYDVGVTLLVVVSHCWSQQSVADLGVVRPVLVRNLEVSLLQLIHNDHTL